MPSPSPIPCIDGDRSSAVTAVGTIFTIAALVLVGLRIFTRVRFVSAGLGWDDFCIVLATVRDYSSRTSRDQGFDRMSRLRGYPSTV